ncbi:phospholipid N-methyltransferase [Pantoea cypripedii]|nr:phospholipid N-methyltransferase [Pantoea cypripedii]
MILTTFSLLKEKTRYMQAFIANPRAFGSIAPSSPSLCRRMSDAVDWTQAHHVAELGAGDGVLTRHLLNRMHSRATLSAYEINPRLALKLSSLNDNRLTVFTDSAEQVEQGCDAIFSCLPLLSLPEPLRHRILQRVVASLNPGGLFIQFQYTSFSEPLLSGYFHWTRTRVMRNLPPALVYRCQSVGVCAA